MKIVVVYVFPVSGEHYYNGACRFVQTYNQFPAGVDHDLVVVSNGGNPTIEMRCLCDLLDHSIDWFVHDNSGYDIGAEQAVCRTCKCNMIVFFGSTAYIRGPNWLARMAEAFEKNGEHHLYGCMANTGDIPIGVYPHIRTTGYWGAPIMLNMYPFRVTQPSQRYEFEHGKTCLTEWFRKRGHRAIMVTWHGEYDWPLWCKIANGFHNGNQSELITGDKISAPPFYPCP